MNAVLAETDYVLSRSPIRNVIARAASAVAAADAADDDDDDVGRDDN